MPRVSIILPVYNSAAFIAQSLATLHKQTFRDWEIVVVDDGSIDDTLAAARATGIPFRLVSQAHQGPGAARNRGVRESRGEWIAFLDADDLWDEKKLERQLMWVDAHPECGAVYTDVLMREQGRALGRKSERITLLSGSIAEAVLLDSSLITTSSLVFRRDLWEKTGPFDESSSIREDWEWFVRLACQTSVAVIPDPLVEYRLHAQNTHRHTDRNYAPARRMIQKALEEYARSGRELTPSLRKRVWHGFYQTYGIAYLFSWQSARALPHFMHAIWMQPTSGRDYVYGLASLLPGRLLKKIQHLRGRAVL